MQTGKFNLDIIESGTVYLDGGAMFGVVPKTLWDKTNPADDKNRIKLTTRNLLISFDDKKILIDNGTGTKTDDKFNKIYGYDPAVNIETALLNKGISPAEITDVILTHLHFDHCGGSTKLQNGEYVPVFPNAKYYVQAEHYKWALSPSDKDKASFMDYNYVPLYENGILKLTEGNEILFEGIELLTVNGHTPAQQLVKIISGDKTLLYCADLLPFVSHIPLPYIMAYDLYPMKTLEEKNKILSEAYEEKWLLFFEHDPFFSTAILGRNDKGFFAEQTNRWD